MTAEPQTFYNLAVALAIGLLIGIERGWQERAAEEGTRVAGVRTYGLIGLLGGAVGLLAVRLDPWIAGMAFLGLSAVLVSAYALDAKRHKDVGITSLVAGLLTFVLGALAAFGEVTVAAASAVITVLLLGLKPVLHGWLSALQSDELRAGMKLLLISVVLLPVLPDQGYGPWQVLNPYVIWWMVVLIAAISFLGYFAVKIGGLRKGTAFTAVFAGLASSTALTLHFSHMAKERPEAAAILAPGILLACGTMFPRMVAVAGLVNAQLIRPLVWPAAIMATVVFGTAMIYWRFSLKHESGEVTPLANPLALGAALKFGGLLVVIMLLGKAFQAWAGDSGVLILAAASGIADVDAITLSLARMSQSDLVARVAASGVVVAAAVNSVVKGGIAFAVGGKRLGQRVGLPLVVAALAGISAVWWLDIAQ